MSKKVKQPARKSTRQEMRALIKKRLLMIPASTDRSIAKTLGCSHNTVSSVRAEMKEKGQFDQMASEYDWRNHPYLVTHPHLIEKLDIRDLRALKHKSVLDRLMADSKLRSPRHAQSVLNKEAKEARKNAVVKLSDGDFRVFCADLRVGLLSEVAAGIVSERHVWGANGTWAKVCLISLALAQRAVPC